MTVDFYDNTLQYLEQARHRYTNPAATVAYSIDRLNDVEARLRWAEQHGGREVANLIHSFLEGKGPAMHLYWDQIRAVLALLGIDQPGFDGLHRLLQMLSGLNYDGLYIGLFLGVWISPLDTIEYIFIELLRLEVAVARKMGGFSQYIGFEKDRYDRRTALIPAPNYQ